MSEGELNAGGRRLPRWIWLLLLLPIILGLTRLRLDIDPLNLLPPHLSVVQGLKLYQENFSTSRELIITLKSDSAEATEQAAAGIGSALREQTNLVGQVVFQPPWSDHPDDAAELAAYFWLNQPPEIFSRLVERLQSTEMTNTLFAAREAMASSLSPREIAKRAYDPYLLSDLPTNVFGGGLAAGGRDFFSSADGTFRMMFVETGKDLRGYRQCVEWVGQVRTLISNSIPAGVPVHFNLTGRPAFVAEVGAGMEHDLSGSVLGTMAIIAGLFWFAHRRWIPLIWILALLTFILLTTMALGGFFFGKLNLLSLGFAAILLGLAVDYGLVLYQEWRMQPEESPAALRHQLGGGIVWSAVTTSAAFLILNLSGLPGLGQLGSLVAMGITLAAVVMLYFYLEPMARWKRETVLAPIERQWWFSFSGRGLGSSRLAYAFTLLILLGALGILLKKWPTFDHSPEALRPKRSAAYEAVEEIRREMGRVEEPLWVLIRGHDDVEVLEKMRLADERLATAVSNGTISAYSLPTSVWPRRENQTANLSAAKKLLKRQNDLRQAALSAGFTTNSLVLFEHTFGGWEKAVRKGFIWPDNPASHWVLSKVAAQTAAEYLALGLIYSRPVGKAISNEENYERTRRLVDGWPEEFQKEGITLSGWGVLAATMSRYTEREFPKVLLPMIGLLLFTLWLAFKRFDEVLLSVATLVFAGTCLFAAMSLLDWSWNLLNLTAIALLLGSGVDYSIHMQLGLRRHHGNVAEVRKRVGRALWLCGGTTIAGFGSLAWSNNAGLASLGKVCAAGIAAVMLTSIYLLPTWWRLMTGLRSRP